MAFRENVEDKTVNAACMLRDIPRGANGVRGKVSTRTRQRGGVIVEAGATWCCAGTGVRGKWRRW